MAHKQTGDEKDLLALSIEYRSQIAADMDALLSEASDGELTALVSYALAFPDGFMSLVDTYDVKRYIFLCCN